MTLPSSISGLAAWYRADGPLWQDTARTVPAVADGDPVGSWDDVSGSSNHAQQATSGKRPLYKLGVQNGMPTIRFDGSDDFLTLLSNFTAGPSSVFAVLKGTNVSSYSGIFVADKIGVYNAGGGGNVWGVYTSAFDYSGQEVYSKFRQISAVIRAPNDMDLVTDGGLLHSTGGSSYQARGSTAIGADPSGIQNAALDVCELLAYNVAVAASDRRLIEEYLRDRWMTLGGVPLAITGIGAYGTRAYGGGVPVLAALPGGGPTTYTVSVAGAITPTGAVVKQIQKKPAAALSPSGGLFVLGPGGILLAGSITPSGVLKKQDGKKPVGAVGPTGSLTLVVNPSTPPPPTPDSSLRAGFIPIA